MNESEEAGQRVSVAEAAGVLGVSKETVRRMIREGRLEAERVETKRRMPTYRVALPEGGVMPARSRRPAQIVELSPPTVDATAAMLAAFSQAVAPLMTLLVAQLVCPEPARGAPAAPSRVSNARSGSPTRRI